MSIKGIIFDLGGILLDIDYQNTEFAFSKMGAKHFDAFYHQNVQNKLFDLFEEGKISSESFRAEVCNLLNISLSEHEFDTAWNAMLLRIQPQKLEYLLKLKQKGIKLFLYSNIDAIHLPDVQNIISRDVGEMYFYSLFDTIYYSHIFGHRKPNPESFGSVSRDIFKQFGLILTELMFIDDTKRHVEGAITYGIRSIHVPSNLSSQELYSIIDSALESVEV